MKDYLDDTTPGVRVYQRDYGEVFVFPNQVDMGMVEGANPKTEDRLSFHTSPPFVSQEGHTRPRGLVLLVILLSTLAIFAIFALMLNGAGL